MTAFMTQEQWDNLVRDCEPERPSVGKNVLVVEGRKHKGKSGKVFWHGEDKFDSTRHYFTAAQLWVQDAIGRRGFRCGIETEDGERFYVPAHYTEVIHSEPTQ